MISQEAKPLGAGMNLWDSLVSIVSNPLDNIAVLTQPATNYYSATVQALESRQGTITPAQFVSWKETLQKSLASKTVTQDEYNKLMALVVAGQSKETIKPVASVSSSTYSSKGAIDQSVSTLGTPTVVGSKSAPVVTPKSTPAFMIPNIPLPVILGVAGVVAVYFFMKSRKR